MRPIVIAFPILELVFKEPVFAELLTAFLTLCRNRLFGLAEIQHRLPLLGAVDFIEVFLTEAYPTVIAVRLGQSWLNTSGKVLAFFEILTHQTHTGHNLSNIFDGRGRFGPALLGHFVVSGQFFASIDC